LAKNFESELYRGLPLASRRLDHTRRAFETLPHLHEPRILDIGCGPGVPTVELARICDGLITGLDTDLESLDALLAAARESAVTSRVGVVRASMQNMPFADESFDLLWSEGSAHIVGIENALTDWRRLIRPDGFLVVHEIVWLRPDPPTEIAEYWCEVFPEFTTAAGYAEAITERGYRLLNRFCLPETAWWEECYGPLAKRIDEWRMERADDPAILPILDAAQRDVDFFRNHSDWCGSAFFMMQKRD